LKRTLIANLARALRKDMTEPEVMLWTRLRGRGGDKPTFRRQHPFGAFIVDFYCPAARLAVEVDGAVHGDDAALERDAARDRWLRGQGLSVVRIPASHIYDDLSEVVDGVLRRAAELIGPEHPCARPAPSTGRSAAAGPPPAASRWR
jgi:very-short-patch-repair endonuclease